jgi:hypothetical protein
MELGDPMRIVALIGECDETNLFGRSDSYLVPFARLFKEVHQGAIVGGVAGSVAGHGKLGAAAGCVVGHHEANKADTKTCPCRKFNPLAVDRESDDAAARCWICAN